MKDFGAFDFACNDPDNGLFASRVFRASYGDAEFEGDFMAGYRFRVEGDEIKLHRRKFKFLRRKYWVGNWCWDRFWFRRDEARRLLKTMRESGLWHCDTGPARFFDWFNRPCEAAP